MTAHTYKSALIVGAGAGLSASLARLFAKRGHGGFRRRPQSGQTGGSLR